MAAFTPPDPNFTPGEWKVWSSAALTGASFAAATDANTALPFVATREIEIDEVWYRDTAVTAVAGNFALGWTPSGTGIPASGTALAAANRIHDNLSLLTATVAANTAVKATLTGGSVYSVPAGAQLFVWSSANQNASALAGLVITIRYREKMRRS